MSFEVVLHPLAVAELECFRAFDQRKVLQAIEAQLKHEPTKRAKNRKFWPA